MIVQKNETNTILYQIEKGEISPDEDGPPLLLFMSSVSKRRKENSLKEIGMEIMRKTKKEENAIN